MKINFEKLPMYTSIRKDETKEVNVKFELANLLYTKGSGVACGSLALKIYNSTGKEEYSNEECEVLKAFTKSFIPIFTDSLKDYIDNNKESAE